ncbi:chemotaxis protein CheX [Desulfoferrobacter suflitae]|uniref:chemotaxis protein CheX n=1 Tax=Desulfoferrobacter suflitae TaxID=2865782 RepID=UPI0021641D3C|nr:chemotaxis protein CheX [Desulfoferrobacter suflitae]MCK8602399.1 chemotaxis protein CheX [Desulfoferrobacter suflitae]
MNQWQMVMKGVISELLETMFFMSVDFESSAVAVAPLYALESQVELVRNMQTVTVHLCMTRPFALVAAANFLGVEEKNVAWKDVEDVAKEMTNMIAGSYKLQLDDSEWSLGIPSIGTVTQAAGASAGTGLPLSHLGEQIGSIFLTESRREPA